MQLLTVLGTGKYETTCYSWQGQQVETCYVTEALCEFFQPEKVVVLLTDEAKAMHWDGLKQKLGDRFPAVDVSIPSGKSEAEIWQIFDVVVDSVEPNSSVIFDITHAFRSIPLLVLLAAAFLQKARNAVIQGVYYGAKEANSKQAPIFDLTPAIKLLDWLTATDKFLSTGSAIELGQLLTHIQSDLHRQKAEVRPTRLSDLARKIQAISRSLELIRPLDLMQESAKLQKISTAALQDEVGVFAKPFELLFSQIQQDYGQFALPASDTTDSQILQRQFLLLRWYVSKELATQAILLAREWIISALLAAEGSSYSDKTQRKAIENQLGCMIGENQDLNQPIVCHVASAKRLSAIWSTLTKYRNDIAHAAENSHPTPAAKLQSYVKERLLLDLTELFPEFTA